MEQHRRAMSASRERESQIRWKKNTLCLLHPFVPFFSGYLEQTILDILFTSLLLNLETNYEICWYTVLFFRESIAREIGQSEGKGGDS